MQLKYEWKNSLCWEEESPSYLTDWEVVQEPKFIPSGVCKHLQTLKVTLWKWPLPLSSSLMLIILKHSTKGSAIIPMNVGNWAIVTSGLYHGEEKDLATPSLVLSKASRMWQMKSKICSFAWANVKMLFIILDLCYFYTLQPCYCRSPCLLHELFTIFCFTSLS